MFISKIILQSKTNSTLIQYVNNTNGNQKLRSADDNDWR